MAKKYLSKIVKGGNTIYVKDAEAQAAIEEMPSAASIQTCEDIISELI